MTRTRALSRIGILLLIEGAAAASAADLPAFGEALPHPHFGPGLQAGLITNPFRGQYVVEPNRFDAYGYPVYGPVVAAAPNPLYAATGCPQLLQPIYDGDGNFAGYGPVQGCR